MIRYCPICGDDMELYEDYDAESTFSTAMQICPNCGYTPADDEIDPDEDYDDFNDLDDEDIDGLTSDSTLDFFADEVEGDDDVD